MTDDERAELIERKYQFLAEQEAAAARRSDPAPALPPVESTLDRERRELSERDAAWARTARARQRQRYAATSGTPSPDWAAHIKAAIAAERDRMMNLLKEAIVEIEVRADRRVEDQLRPLRVELAELRIANAELRIGNARLREQLTGGGAVSAGTLSVLN